MDLPGAEPSEADAILIPVWFHWPSAPPLDRAGKIKWSARKSWVLYRTDNKSVLSDEIRFSALEVWAAAGQKESEARPARLHIANDSVWRFYAAIGGASSDHEYRR